MADPLRVHLICGAPTHPIPCPSLLGSVAIDVVKPDSPIVSGQRRFDIADEPYIVQLTGDFEELLCTRFSGTDRAYVLGKWPQETDHPQMYV